MEENRVVQGTDKLTTLEEAIAAHVRPGMTVHIETRARAANRALTRAFWGTKPDFTLCMVRLGAGHGVPLVFGGLTKRIITGGYSDQYPSVAPIKFIQEAYKNGIEFENWSLCGYISRMKAGALGTGFIPTKSMIGTTMEIENSDVFKVVDDPFGSGKRVGLLKALNPNVSFVHADAVDGQGNAIFLPPWEEGLWGAKASKGVIVTAEKLVSQEFIKEHSFLVKLPGTMVKAVVHAPFGSHPGVFSNLGLSEFNRYGLDRDFLLDHRAALQGGHDAYGQWVKDWIIDVRNHEEYLAKVDAKYGPSHVDSLHSVSASEEGQEGGGAKSEGQALAGGFNATEMMVAAGGRIMAEKAMKNGYQHIQPGIGTGALAAFVAYHLTHEAGHRTELVVGTGFYGFVPRPSTLRSEDDCKMLTDTLEMYSVFIGGETVKSIVALGAGQIDKHGNLNSTRTKDGLLLAGVGGSNDAANAREVVVIARQSSRRFVDEVSYITVPGTRITTLVSNMGVYEKNGDGELVLTQYFAKGGDTSADDCIREVKEQCGWDLKVAPGVRAADLPTTHELEIMRYLDPRGDFLGR
ncbi:MAG: CoA-transferase [Chloroflexota bacterium]